ncbi:MAG TPA: hypothetical protein VEF35_07470 [Candidatus Bathyarchaeia archaeon]|nr:hypothetical protein [Candidatus Bathyarchaeia archaeon]
MIADAKMDELTRTMDLERALRGKVGRVSPALAIAQKDLLGRNTRVPFWACVFPLAFGVASSS